MGLLLFLPRTDTVQILFIILVKSGCLQKTAAGVYHNIPLENGLIMINKEECNNCGRCAAACPFGAIEGQDGYKVYIGGRWGKKVGRGIPIDKIFNTKQSVLNAVEKTILFFREQGIAGERLAETVERVGFENAQMQIVSDDIFLRKEEILADK